MTILQSRVVCGCCVLIVGLLFSPTQLFAENIDLTVTVDSGVSAPPPPPPPPSSGGGGGGGGGGVSVSTGVTISGRAYPLSQVIILKDGQRAASTISGPDAIFSVSLTDLSAGSYNFSVFTEDKNGTKSAPFVFPIFLTSGAITNVSGIFIAPTIGVDKSVVKRGDTINVFGQTVPQGDVTIGIHSDEEIFLKTRSDASGVYSQDFDTSVLANGAHSARSKATFGKTISPFSTEVNFSVGTTNVAANNGKKCPQKGDLNNDCRVNLVDFSIMAFWYKRTLVESGMRADLNGDKKVDLIDFSIMAYYWTG